VKKALVVMFMMIMMVSVKVHAGKGGLFGCCCGGDDGGGGGDSVYSSLVPNLGTRWIVDFEDFKKWFTQDGDCEIRTSRYHRSTLIEEDLKAGRGSKTLVFDGLDFMHKRVRNDKYIYLQLEDGKGTVIQKGNIIDREEGEIRDPNKGRGVRFYQ
jgi:hypothetical protein